MPKLYSFICSSCGRREDSDSGLPYRCSCGALMRRDFNSFRIGKSMRPHFNHSVGSYVNNTREFRDALKRRGEEAGTDYTPIDMNEAPGVTEEGLDATRARRREIGIDQPTKRIFT